MVSVAAVSADGFQSTHPMRGATGTDTLLINIPEDFNPRTPCGVRLCVMRPIIRETWHFNPRTPCGVRPGSDPDRRVQGHFNPRTPCGVRLPVCSFRTAVSGFQSTHPMRGATKLLQYTAPIIISIHAPHAGCDKDKSGAPTSFHISIHAPHAGCDPELQVAAEP